MRCGSPRSRQSGSPVTEPDDEGDRRRTYSLEIGLAKIEGKLDAMIAVQAATTASVSDLDRSN